MKFIASFYTTNPIENIVKWAGKAEESGFDSISLTDWAPTTQNDAFLMLAKISTVLKRVSIGTTICNPYSRHPAMIARMVRTIYSLSGGRVFLGIGAGGPPALLPLGIKTWEKPIATVRDAVQAVRRLLRGEGVSVESYTFKVSNLRFEDEPVTIPIYIGARRPQMLRLSGKIADGVILGSCPEEIVMWSIKHVKEGLARAERDISNFNVFNWMSSSISDDSDEARELIRPKVASAIYQQPLEILRETRHDFEALSRIKAKVAENKLGEAASMVTDEMIDAFSLAGTPEEIIEKIERQRSAGVTHIVFGQPLGKDVERAMETIGKEVIPAFAN
jgi:5,10-methylenetetrahydromethanopterin reductase